MSTPLWPSLCRCSINHWLILYSILAHNLFIKLRLTGFCEPDNDLLSWQICRVEDIVVEGSISGSVVHFHWVRNVVVHSSGVITASGLGILSVLLLQITFIYQK